MDFLTITGTIPADIECMDFYLIVPIDDMAKSIFPKPCIVDSATYFHLIDIYHGEFRFYLLEVVEL